MFSFFKNKNIDHNNDEDIFSKVASLLIHIAKIDQNYTAKEKEIVSKTILELGAKKENIENIISIAEKNESNSNQILEFTKEVKNIKEPYLLLNHYMYSIINDVEPGEKGLIKGNPYEGEKKKKV